MEGGCDVILTELQDEIALCTCLRIVGSGSRSSLLPVWKGKQLSTYGLTGMISISAEDLVFEAWAGTAVGEIQNELAKHHLCLPLTTNQSLPEIVCGTGGTLGGLIAMNLPHSLSSQWGGPKEWTLGMTIIRADGSTAKCGSKVVKNVAGYDVHKLFVGSRGSLGLIAKVTMRAYSTRNNFQHSVELLNENKTPKYVARTLHTDFDQCINETEDIIAIDKSSCTLWSTTKPREIGKGWIIGPQGLRGGGTHSGYLENAAIRMFDPTTKFSSAWEV